MSIILLAQWLFHSVYHRKNSHPHRVNQGWSWGRLAESAEKCSCSWCHKRVRVGSFVPENAVSILQHPVGMHRSVENVVPFSSIPLGMHPSVVLRGVGLNRRREDMIGAGAYSWLSQGLFRAGQFPHGFGLSVATWDFGA